MGMVDQVYAERAVVPLKGPLAEIQRILDRVQNPEGRLSSEDAIAAIAREVRKAERPSSVYQKPLG
jgi:hypothetical protein